MGKTTKSVVLVQIVITLLLERIETCPSVEALGYYSGVGLKSNHYYQELVIA